MSKPILRSKSDFFFYSSVGIVSQKDPFIRKIVWSRDDFKSLPLDTRIPIKLCIRNMDDRGKFFDIQNGLFLSMLQSCIEPFMTPEYSLDKLLSEMLYTLCLLKFEGIEPYITVLTK